MFKSRSPCCHCSGGDPSLRLVHCQVLATIPSDDLACQNCFLVLILRDVLFMSNSSTIHIYIAVGQPA